MGHVELDGSEAEAVSSDRPSVGCIEPVTKEIWDF